MGHGFTVKYMIDDGNCMHRTLSDAKYGDQKYYRFIRKQIYVEMLNNPLIYKDSVNFFLEAKTVDSHVTNYVEYIEEMALNKKWGGEIEF